MPQIVLHVPPEVTRVLSAILGCLQRIEQEVREARLRLGYPVVHRADGPNANATAIMPATPRPLAKQVQAALKAPRRLPAGAPLSIHTPAGPKAAARVEALLGRLELKRAELADKLGFSDQMLWNIVSQKSGISVRMDAALAKLEALP